MMVRLPQNTVIGLFAVILAAGCGSDKGDMSPERLKAMAGGKLVETVPVSGTITVDGEPTAGVNLILHKSEGFAAVKESRTDADGKYVWSTHLSGDGIEPGSYVVTFEYIPKPKKNDKGVDLFKGKYKNPSKSEFKLTVESGMPQKDVNYELTMPGKK